MIPYGRQLITPDDIEAVTSALLSDFLTQGPRIAEFEKAFAAYTGARYAIAVSNGTAALHLGALALGVNGTSKAITTPVTFAASANCIRYCGGQIEFADIDPETFLIDLNIVEDKLKKADKGVYSGIIPVNLAGYPVHLEELKILADRYGVWIMEDACHSPGGYFTDSKGKKQYCGNGEWADLSVFSFHPVKHIACGEGGMITTGNKELYEKIMLLRTHGITKDPNVMSENHGGWYYEMTELGYNYRLTDMQAALGSSQLARADEGIKRRKEIASVYDNAFENTNVNTPALKQDIGHAYHLYIIQVEDRLGLYNHLRSKDIFAQVHYIPLHLMPYYRNLGHKKGDYPIAEKYYESCLSIPMYPSLEKGEQDFVIREICNYCK
jgi:UDP-4-amino-4,6-dideoxy-N-acetyl-beta-L-altrosamine transaminase